MKVLTSCAKGSSAIVARINASGPLKRRFLSLGIMKGAELTVLAYSAVKSTLEIRVGKMQLALRREEAELIEIEA